MPPASSLKAIRNRQSEILDARLTQIMNFRLLAPDIQAALLHLPCVLEGRPPIKYRDLMPILQDPAWKKQREKWESIFHAKGRAGIDS